MPSKNYILTKEVAQKKFQRMAYEIVERNADEDQIILAGIKENGLVIAKTMAALLQPVYKGQLTLMEININKKNLSEINLSPSFDLNNKVIIITDDVVNAGRTLLYAIKPMLEFYPKKIQTLVLVERTHKTFPINSDYVGLSIATTFQEHIFVEVDGDEVSGAYMI